jgi:uncharacterized membrane protein
MAQHSPTLTENRTSDRSRRVGARTRAHKSAHSLGLFGLGLGLTQVFAPAAVAKFIGVPDKPGTRLALRLIGARELVSSLGLLSRPEPSAWAWGRLAGDAMDLVLLAGALNRSRAVRPRIAAALVAVAGAAAVDAVSATRLSPGSKVRRLIEPIHVLKSITVNRPPEEVYKFWRDLENLPVFMGHLESVRVTNGRSTWTAKGPAAMSIEWQAEIVMDRPYESIGWKSVEGSTSVPNRGVVRFAPAPGDRGTEVTVELKYEPPAGALGAAFAKLFGEEPSQQIAGDLRRLKQVLETGEVVHSDASIHKGMHPARPTADGAIIAGARK